MTTTPSDEPQVPETGATPPPPPAAPDYTAAPDYPAPPPAAPEYTAPPPAASGYPAAPAAGGYQQAPPAQGYGQPGGYAGAPAPGYAAPAVPLSDSDQRMWATIAHIGGALTSFVAPLVIWLIFKERGRFVDEQAKEALNFQILIAIAYVICSLQTVVIIGAFLLPVVWIVAIVFGIIAAMAANKGEAYRYPFSLRLVK